MTLPIEVLVVDDDADTLNGTRRLLEQAGYSVSVAADGEAALNAVRASRPQLILLDRDLPGIDGVEVCRRIKLDADLVDCLVVLASSAYATTDDMAEGLEAGADGYILRPVSNRVLLARVHSYARIAALMADLRHTKEALEQSEAAANRSQAAALNLAEDALEARRVSEALNRWLQHEARERAQVDSTLRASDELHRLILRTAQDGLWITDLHGRILEVNEAYCRRSGYSEAELLTMSIQDLRVGKSAAWVEANIDQLVEHGGGTFDSEHRCKDGSTWHLEVSVTHLSIEDGRLVVFMHDITERQTAQDELRRTNENLVEAQRLAKVGSWYLDIASNQVTWSHELFEMYEVDPAESVPPYPEQHRLFTPRSWELLTATLANTTATGVPYELDLETVRMDGSNRWTHVRGEVIKDEHGATVGLSGIAQDVTDQRRANIARAESELRLASIIESSMDAIITVDDQQHIVIFNPAAEAIFRLSRRQAIGLSLDHFIPASSHQRHHQQMAAFGSESSPALPRALPSPTTGLRADGEEFRMEATVSKVRIGDHQYFTAVLRDLTERDRIAANLETTESQLRHSQKMEAFGELAGGVAHDFNNILAVISMQVELTAMEPGLSSSAQEGLELVRMATERAAQLTNQLLVFSRRQVLQSTRLDLNQTVRAFDRMLQRLIGEHVQLTLQLQPSPLIVRGDNGMLEQAILNLVLNSRDAMPSGGSIIIATDEIDLRDKDAAAAGGVQPGLFARLRVIDEGLGVPPEMEKQIFEPFFTTKDVGKGTGLGLATVLGIVQQHRGAITLAPTPGGGTTMEILLPIEPDEVTETDVRPAAQVRRTGTETILLVEDDLILRRITRDTLERAGYRVLEAGTGVEALAVSGAGTEPIDVLFTDTVMPGGMSGPELAEQLQREQPNLAVIITTGYSHELSGKELVLPGRQAFLRKPYLQGQLFESIREVLDS